MEVINRLYELEDKKYAEFQSKLTPNIDKDLFIGVRVPLVRKLAREYIKEAESKKFMQTLPHKYYDENMLHGLLISEIRDYDTCIKEINRFLPYIDNWAVCDITSPKVFKKNKNKLIIEIKKWVKSSHTYTVRFGIEMLMSHYLDDDYNEEYLLIPSKVKSDEYYIIMMQAWFYATALAKRWDDTILYFENKKLDKAVHNKAIQKAIESYRITDKQKEYLKSMKI